MLRPPLLLHQQHLDVVVGHECGVQAAPPRRRAVLEPCAVLRGGQEGPERRAGGRTAAGKFKAAAGVPAL